MVRKREVADELASTAGLTAAMFGYDVKGL